MPPSSSPSEIKTIDDLDTVLSNIGDIESDISGDIVEDEILPSWKEKKFDQSLDWIVEAWNKLKDAEDLDVFKGREEQDRIEAGLRTLKSVESMIQQAIHESDEQRELQESD
ncbi:hypothetical protein K445DRAFT_24344 [Daldinia sp. EC12]|nr:hypothetical protein F4774DRAFT_425429 [Daldinia eschscholtzii]OTB13849.1 hypothetical protein K445DRAFT_24344 [Daldinia sp. EC12]